MIRSLPLAVLTLLFDVEGRVRANRIDVEFFDMLDEPKARASGKVVLECFNIRRRPLSQHFDAAVIKVLNIANDLMPRGRALGKETITDALHVAADNKPACNSRYGHEWPNLILSGALRNLRFQYRLAFKPDDLQKDGSVHLLRVKVDAVDVAVRARKQYRAAGNTQ